MTSVVLWTAAVPGPRIPDRVGGRDASTDAAGTGPAPTATPLPAVPPAPLPPPPVPPVLVVAGTGHRELFAELVGAPLAEQPATAYLMLRSGEPGGRAYIPGHRDPRELIADGTASGPPTRPPRRVALSRPAPLLDYVHLVFAPTAPPAPAATEVLVDAVRHSDGLVYVLDAGEPLSPDRRDELAAVADVARRVVLVDPHGTADTARSTITRQVPRLACACWSRPDDLPAALARSGAAPSGLRSAPELQRAPESRVRVSEDDTRWRAALAAELRARPAAVYQRLVPELAAIEARCALDPAALPALLDTELHALSLRTTEALDEAARDLIRAVFAEVVADRLTDAVQARVAAAVCRELEPDDRTLLVTATAGVAVVDGAAGALSATGASAPTILAPVGLAVSGNCNLMWHYRGVPDKATGRRWLRQATQALDRELARLLEARFAALGEAVEALAGEAVDHGVLLA